MLHSLIAEEQGCFGLNGMIQGISEKDDPQASACVRGQTASSIPNRFLVNWE